MKRLALAAMLALAACSPAASVPQRVVEPRAAQGDAPRGEERLRRAMLAGHDAARAEVGLGPVSWDDRLAQDATDYAYRLAASGRFEHSSGRRGAEPQGENLWTGTRGAYAYDEMIGHWVAEKVDFVNRPTPGFSRSGRWGDVAHYTQIVWRASTRIGCGVASNRSDDFLVCRYAPPGNMVGQVAF